MNAHWKSPSGRSFCLIITIMVSGYLAAQTPDTLRIRTLIANSRELVQQCQFQPAFAACDSAAELISDTVNSLLYAEVSDQRGYCWIRYGKSKTALSFCNQALEVRIANGDSTSQETARVWFNLGHIYLKRAQYSSAMKCATTALHLRQRALPEVSVDVAEAHNLLGSAFRESGDPLRALSHHRKALEICNLLSGKRANIVKSMALQNIGNSYMKISRFDSVLYYYGLTITLQESVLGKDHPDVATSFSNLSFVFGAAEGKSAMERMYQTRATTIRKKCLPPDHSEIIVSYLSWGNIFISEGQLDSALIYFQKVIDMTQEEYGIVHPFLGTAWLETGIAYYNRGLYRQAEQATKNALEIYKQVGGSDRMAEARCLQMLGGIYEQMKDLEKAVAFMQQALDLKENLLYLDWREIASTLNDLGVVQRELEDYENSARNLTRVIISITNNYSSKHFLIANACFNLVKTYADWGKPDTALTYYIKGIQIYAEIGIKENAVIAAANDYIGQAYLHKGEAILAGAYFSAALEMRYKEFEDVHPAIAASYAYLAATSFYQNDPYKTLNLAENSIAATGFDGIHFESINSLSPFLDGQHLKAAALIQIGQESRQESKILEACAALNLADSAGTLLRLSFFGGGSQQLLSKKMLPVYERAISARMFLKNENALKEAFTISEKSRSLALLEAVRGGKAEYFAGVPDSLIDLDRALESQINLTEKKREEEMAKYPSRQSVIEDCNNKLFELKEQRGQLIYLFRERYPALFNLRFGSPQIDVTRVQKELLEPGQALLEYFVGAENLYIFLIGRNEFQAQSIKIDFPLSDLVKQMRDGINAYYMAPLALQSDELWAQTMENYTSASCQLYDKILSPVAKYLPERLIIIPDGILSYVPFEALLLTRPISTGDFGEYDYLIKKHQISYCYSAALLREMTDRTGRRQPTLPCVGFAPEFSGDTFSKMKGAKSSGGMPGSLAPIQYNNQEVMNLNVRFKGRGMAFYKSEATESAFVQHSPKARLVFLATHAAANDKTGDYCWLAFTEQKDSVENEWLFAKEIYNMRLAADLVVLSSCETGAGELRRGEGVLCLNRAFAYAGAKSIVSSLWAVDDELSAVLTDNFFRRLIDEKEPKDEALRQAKLDFFQWASINYKEKALHPFFWAGYIALGDMHSIKF